MYLHDVDCLEFLIKAKESLMITDKVSKNGNKKSGLLFVKDNIVSEPTFYVNTERNEVYRTLEHYVMLFESAELTILT